VNAKERRDLIFRKSRPHFRKADLLNLDGTYGEDMKMLWAAYKAGSFPVPQELTQEQFAEWVVNEARNFNTLWIGEDRSDAYKSGKGPVCLVATNTQGMVISAEGRPFKWASLRNVLRAAVGFLHMVTKSNKTGLVMVKCDEKSRPLADHLKKYGLLFYVGKSGQSEYLYSVRGRGSD